MNNKPYSPIDIFKLNFIDRIVYSIAIQFFRITRLWDYPQKREGDINKMKLLDKIYWLYKTKYPIRKATKNSKLEKYFSKQDIGKNLLKDNFIYNDEISISCVGDLIIHPFLSNSNETLYEDPLVQDAIFSVDVSMANLECPIWEYSHEKFQFNTQTAPILNYSQSEFNCVKGCGPNSYSFMSTACNHSLDFGAEGLKSTIRCLKENGINQHGINLSKEDSEKPEMVMVKGIKIANIAFTFGLNAKKAPEHNPEMVNVLNLNGTLECIDLTRIECLIERSQNAGSDFIILHLHWGLEHEFYPSEDQISLAHHLAELGADAIIGHHPHVIQPIEIYRTKRDLNRTVPIYYSLGNLVNYFSAPWLRKSRVAQLVLSKGINANGEQKVYLKCADHFDVVQEINEENSTLLLRPA